MTPVYSIVIPVYNAEKYLESCVQSVLNQSTESAFEVILVNDGSRDGSGAICDRLAQQDKRFHVIHQVNQGVSAARNAGI
ncbi:MAG: glycosyltransferase, partial [Firmicutes bacterium]|nr:glycosyltransferase [Bacillota bacterium]